MTIALHHGVRIHAYADNLQTYASCKAVKHNAEICQIQACITDIDGWLSSNRLKFNADKTEFIWLGKRQQFSKLTQQSLNINDVSLAPVSKDRDLEVVLDDELSTTAHVNHVVSGSFYQLRQLCSVRRCLSFDARRALVTAFISSRLNYCKVNLYSVAASNLHRLQVVMNAVA